MYAQSLKYQCDCNSSMIAKFIDLMIDYILSYIIVGYSQYTVYTKYIIIVGCV